MRVTTLFQLYSSLSLAVLYVPCKTTPMSGRVIDLTKPGVKVLRIMLVLLESVGRSYLWGGLRLVPLLVLDWSDPREHHGSVCTPV